MKPRILFFAICALCALASCHTAKQPEPQDISSPPPASDQPTTPGLAEALDKMHFENAPTLGPVYRQCLADVYGRNYDALYDLLSTHAREQLVKNLSDKIAELQTWVKQYERKLAGPGLTDEEKADLTRGLNYTKARLAELQALNGDANKYLAFTIERTLAGANLEEMFKVEGVVLREEINGDHGTLKLKSELVGDTIRSFVKENGVWKIDLMYTSEAPAPPNP